jgi:hypothetical protein
MCSANAWVLEGWRPFGIERADFGMNVGDADAPLVRGQPLSQSPDSVFPGVPLS